MRTKDKFIVVATNIITYALTLLAYIKIGVEPTTGIMGFLLIIPIAVTSLSLVMTAEIPTHARKETNFPTKK